MKKLYFFLLFVGIATTISTLAMEPPRHTLYDVLDPLMVSPRQVDWNAIFTILDKMQGTFPVNAYRTPEDDLSLLDIAVRNGNLLAAKTLIEKYDANPNIPHPKHKISQLIAAIYNRDLPMIQLLLNYEADPYAADIYGDNSFDHADVLGATRIQELLDLYK